MKLNTLVRFLNKLLSNSKIPDASRNGLQVRATTDVKKIGFAVDACMETFEKAKKEGCDLIIVHHGLFWKGQKDIFSKKRVNFLKKNKISLFASHLPLDLNKEYGNNIVLSMLFDLKKVKKFGKYHGLSIGYGGVLEKPMNLKSFVSKVEKLVKTECQVIGFGKRIVKSIAIVSGGGSSALEEAIENRYDVFLTGEFKHSDYHVAKEGKINMIGAGHYATEVFGVLALEEFLKQKFNIWTLFLHVPTRL